MMTKSAPIRDSARFKAAWKIAGARSRQPESTDRGAPDGELAGDIEQPPASVAEAEHQCPLGEDFDFLRGRKDDADVTAGPGGLGMAQVRARAGMNQRLASLGRLCPSSDVDEPDKVSLAIDQEESAHAIAEAVEALDGREPGVEGGGAFDDSCKPARPDRARCPAGAHRSRRAGSRKWRAQPLGGLRGRRESGRG